MRDPSRVVAPSKVAVSDFWGDLDDWLIAGLIFVPGLVLIVLGAIFIAPEVAFGAILLLVGWGFFNGWFELF